uniref:RNA binding motif protein n=1 Tax=Riptortus pedestris TaxID=329032 RepID=R4WD88_RIPPE|nr:RNA binding motif protein [Riptortus pedestris]
MSRIIVKNLPNNVTSDKVKEKFSEFGRVTDVQLKFTPDGKFRKFGFVGFEKDEEAQNALTHLDKTFFGTSRIDVQICTELGDSKKPKSWSKYAADSSAFQKIHGKKIDSMVAQLSKHQKKKKKTISPEVIESLQKYMDHPYFMEFLELRGKKDLVLKILKEQAEKKESNSEVEEEKSHSKEEEKENKSAAFAAISDSEYLKLKTKGKASTKDFDSTKPSDQQKVQLYNIKLRNLPYKAKKKDVKELFAPLVPASIRFIENVKGVAYVGFKSEKEMRQALVKNKTFLSGKQILINEIKEKVGFQKPDKWKEQEDSLKNEECIAESGRIFVRNLPYSVTEEELEKLFSEFGPVTEVVLPVDKIARQVRGYGVITFLMPEHAVAAYCKLDGTIFHGRMLHLLPGKAKEEPDESTDAPYKVTKEKKLKATAGSSHNWNTLFIDHNAIADVVAEKYNSTREEVLTGSDAAVRLALGETQIVNETKKFLEDNGVHLDAFNQEASSPRSKTVILVKNLPAGTSVLEIRNIFSKHGELGRILLPPSGATAIVEFLEPSEARSAFRQLAYTKFKHLPLYLEWAPNNTFKANTESKAEEEGNNVDGTQVEDIQSNGAESKSDGISKSPPRVESDEEIEPEPNTTLFVKNLNFETNEKSLKEHFEFCGKVSSVQVAKKKDTKNPGAFLSMGYGFVRFYRKSSVDDALKRLQGSKLDGHVLELKRSNKTLVPDVVNVRKKTNLEEQTGSKILVRNIPFQATEKEIENLFKTFGVLKFVRLPKKLVGTGPHRGFGFVEYLSKSDAKRAMKALCQSTHLFGRRLVLEWAKEDEGIAELRKRTAQHFHPDSPSAKNKKATFSLNENQVENMMDEPEDEM